MYNICYHWLVMYVAPTILDQSNLLSPRDILSLYQSPLQTLCQDASQLQDNQIINLLYSEFYMLALQQCMNILSDESPPNPDNQSQCTKF